jgi:signal transduction histidine kinase
VCEVPAIRVQDHESAADVAELFEKHRIYEAVVFSKTGSYLGLITAESAFEWLQADQRVARTELERLRTLSIALGGPMRSIRRYTEALIAASAREREYYARLIQWITCQIDRIAEKTQRLPQHEPPSQSGHKEKSELDRVFDDAIEFHRIRLDERKAIISKRCALADAGGDYISIFQVFANALENALEHTPLGQVPTIEVWSDHVAGKICVLLKTSGSALARQPAGGRAPVLPSGIPPGDSALSPEWAVALQAANDSGSRMTVGPNEGQGTLLTLFLPAPVSAG